MSDFHTIWRDQCDAAEGIRLQFGMNKALGYIIGEKLVNFAHAAMTDRDIAMELPKFATEVRARFGATEIRNYLDGVKRIGSLGWGATKAHENVRQGPRSRALRRVRVGHSQSCD